ncbi:MAG: hypothetical protein HKN45_08385 [Flavobacteriales bacterium]|nr:hypothetical protein [Flavobacteriales bacterium]NNK81122.1 hypothetical protein [Flavobacteriales bacterium]
MNILAIIILLLCPAEDPKEIDSERELARMTKQELIASAEYLSPEEKAMVWEINLVRSDPQAYIPFVQEELAKLKLDSARLSSIRSESIRRRVTTVNGQEVVNVDTVYLNYYQNRLLAMSELLIELGKTVPMDGLEPSEPLHRAAVKHGDSQAEDAYIDHRGKDGSWPLDRHLKEASFIEDGNENIVRTPGDPRSVVIQLLIDSGVPHRGHRQNILAPKWKYISCHHVRQLDEGDIRWWLQEFAY